MSDRGQSMGKKLLYSFPSLGLALLMFVFGGNS